jgi:hypothetical protein
MQRAGLGGASNGGDMDVETETKAFNAIRRSYAEGKQIADVSSRNTPVQVGAFFSYVRKGKLEALSDAERKAMLAGDDSNGGYLLPPSTIGRVVKKALRALADPPDRRGAGDLHAGARGHVRQRRVVVRLGRRRPARARPPPRRRSASTASRRSRCTPTRRRRRRCSTTPRSTSRLARRQGRGQVRARRGRRLHQRHRRRPAARLRDLHAGATGDATRTWGQIEKVKTGANGDFAASNPADKLFDLIQAFKTAYLQNAQWVTTREVIAKVRKFKEATTNAYMWQPGLQAGHARHAARLPDRDRPGRAGARHGLGCRCGSATGWRPTRSSIAGHPHAARSVHRQALRALLQHEARRRRRPQLRGHQGHHVRDLIHRGRSRPTLFREKDRHMKRNNDMHNNVKVLRVISPVAIGTTGTGKTGKIIDRQGYGGVEFLSTTARSRRPTASTPRRCSRAT